MEELDRKILALLAHDGRISYTDIGRETGLSTSAAQQRVRRLEQRGVIKGYSAQLDHNALGRMITAFISVSPFDSAENDETVAKLEPIPEIVSCYSVAGEANYLLMVRVDSPLELERLLFQIRSAAGVSTRTTLVLSAAFEERPNL